MEIWKPIIGYEGYYEVSNMGNIRSVERKVECPNRWGGFNIMRYESILLKPITINSGYLVVTLSKKNKPKRELVHRLVAEAFIPNPDKKPEVNHINEIKTDNRSENLEWMTKSENLHYGTGVFRGHHNRDRKWHREHYGGLNPHSKKVIQLSIDNKIIKEWECINEASRALNINSTSIGKCANGKIKMAGGFKWKSKY